MNKISGGRPNQAKPVYRRLDDRPNAPIDFAVCFLAGLALMWVAKNYRALGMPFSPLHLVIGLATGFLSPTLLRGFKRMGFFILGSIGFFPLLILVKTFWGNAPQLAGHRLAVFEAGAIVAVMMYMTWVVSMPLGFWLRRFFR